MQPSSRHLARRFAPPLPRSNNRCLCVSMAPWPYENKPRTKPNAFPWLWLWPGTGPFNPTPKLGTLWLLFMEATCVLLWFSEARCAPMTDPSRICSLLGTAVFGAPSWLAWCLTPFARQFGCRRHVRFTFARHHAPSAHRSRSSSMLALAPSSCKHIARLRAGMLYCIPSRWRNSMLFTLSYVSPQVRCAQCHLDRRSLICNRVAFWLEHLHGAFAWPLNIRYSLQKPPSAILTRTSGLSLDATACIRLPSTRGPDHAVTIAASRSGLAFALLSWQGFQCQRSLFLSHHTLSCAICTEVSTTVAHETFERYRIEDLGPFARLPVSQARLDRRRHHLHSPRTCSALLLCCHCTEVRGSTFGSNALPGECIAATTLETLPKVQKAYNTL